MNTMQKEFIESEVPEDPSKRNFIKGAGATLVLASSPLISACAGLTPRTLEETLRDYNSITKGWDPIYGPTLLWSRRYGGLNDFKGHMSDPEYGAKGPGVDYALPIGTPLVPVANAFLHDINPHRDTGGLVIWLYHGPVAQGHNTIYAHLSDKKIDERYYWKSGIYRLINCNEIFALSGNSGRGPKEFGGIQREHLHLGLYKRDEKGEGEYLDPEKHGIDGGKPVFSDGETNLSIRAERRLSALEKTLKSFENELQTWPDDKELEELKGTLMEHYHALGDYKGTRILDSRHFHDMRALLIRKTLEEKKYIPGAKPYSMTLMIVGYSTDEKQPIILTLPFIAHGVLSKYRVAVYEQGEFLKPK